MEIYLLQQKKKENIWLFSKPLREASKLCGWGLYCRRNVTFQSVLSSLRGFASVFFPPHGVESHTHASSSIFLDKKKKIEEKQPVPAETWGSGFPPIHQPEPPDNSRWAAASHSCLIILTGFFLLFVSFLHEHFQLNYLQVNNAGNCRLGEHSLRRHLISSKY